MVGLNPSEKYEFVNWDDEIPNISGKIKNVPNHQPDIYIYTLSGRSKALRDVPVLGPVHCGSPGAGIRIDVGISWSG